MKSKLDLISSLIQLIFGVLAVLSFIIILINGENVIIWIPALMFAIVLIVRGFIGIMNYIKY